MILIMQQQMDKHAVLLLAWHEWKIEKTSNLCQGTGERKMSSLYRIFFILFFLLFPLSTLSFTTHYRYHVIKIYPHDTHAFTEGLVFNNGYLYESTGLYQQSTLRKVALATGKILKKYALAPHYFAEGLTVIDSHLYQLTYKENIGFVYEKNTFQVEKIFYYGTEGWGLTTDGKQLIMSNGSTNLLFLDKETFKITKMLAVHDENNKTYSLNELEYINGKIYANVWPTSFIAIISVENGKIEGWIDIAKLYPKENCDSKDCVANGIAYDNQHHTLLVTGKNWPFLYAIKLLR